MKFSVFQLSRRGGREKNEDRMGYCYTRDPGCSCWPTAWAAIPMARWRRRSRCRRFPPVPAPARTRLAVVPDFLSGGVLAAHHQIMRYASARAARHAAHHGGGRVVQDGMLHWVHCGDSRLYLVREGACWRARATTMPRRRRRRTRAPRY
jgi:hypothetical protein